MSQLVEKEITRKVRSETPRKPDRPVETVKVMCYDLEYGKRRKEAQQETAKLRKAKRDKITPQQQIEVLDQKLGKDAGAKKERARLLKQIEEGNKREQIDLTSEDKNKGQKRKPSSKRHNDGRPKGKKGGNR